MTTDENPLTEILCMASVYRAHRMYDFAIKMIRELIELNHKSLDTDRAWLALAQYNLAEIYSDQGNYILAKALYVQAAENWEGVCPKDPANLMWYSKALLSLQNQTDRLILGRHMKQGKRDYA
jgi:tetratricopeptide (TPR) repeat protein